MCTAAWLTMAGLLTPLLPSMTIVLPHAVSSRCQVRMGFVWVCRCRAGDYWKLQGVVRGASTRCRSRLMELCPGDSCRLSMAWTQLSLTLVKT